MDHVRSQIPEWLPENLHFIIPVAVATALFLGMVLSPFSLLRELIFKIKKL